MATKLAGYGTIVKYGSTAVGEVRSVTPPPRTYARVESDDLDSTLKSSIQGVEEESDVEFVQLWEPGDTVQIAAVDTQFSNKTSATWSLVYAAIPDGSGGTTATATDAFSAVVMSITPAEIDNSSILSRTVVLNRQGAITTT